MVDHVGFRQFIQLIQHRLQHNFQHSRHAVPTLYEAGRERIKAALVRVEGHTVHYTSDIWTGHQWQHTYLLLAGHWYDVQ